MNRDSKRAAAVVLATMVFAGCATAPGRPSRSTLGCAEAVVSTRVPPGMADKPTHCMAAAMISRYCSRTEATLASIGKELKDLFTAGDAEWADLRADREGLRCARQAGDEAAIGECCRVATGAPSRLPD